MSRRGVAALAGVPVASLLGWLERGRAQPDEEPWGSFAVDYERAARGLEGAAASTIGLVVAQLHRLALAGDWEALNDSGPQLKELLNVLASRWPEDWGIGAHRKPEQDPNPDAWLERTGATHAQLVHAFREPPEEIRLALVEAAPEVYALLVAAGFKPSEVK
jgi:hypothetical protein